MALFACSGLFGLNAGFSQELPLFSVLQTPPAAEDNAPPVPDELATPPKPITELDPTIPRAVVDPVRPKSLPAPFPLQPAITPMPPPAVVSPVPPVIVEGTGPDAPHLSPAPSLEHEQSLSTEYADIPTVEHHGCGCSSNPCGSSWIKPVWIIEANALFLNRSGLPARTLLVDDTATPIFDAQQLNLPFQPGWELLVQRRFGGAWSDFAVDARYFNIGNLAANGPVVNVASGASVPFADFPRGAFGAANTDSTFEYTSRLQSVESNILHNTWENVSLLVGLRYLNFSDRLTIDQLTNTSFNAIHEFRGVNDLYGAQMGVDALLYHWGHLELESTLKAGIYNNNALNSISYRTNLFGINESSGMVRDCTSFVGELNLNLTYSLTRELSIRGGYQLIWIDGVALASEQPSLNSGNFLTPVSAVDTNNSLFYHGALAGLEWVW